MFLLETLLGLGELLVKLVMNTLPRFLVPNVFVERLGFLKGVEVFDLCLIYVHQVVAVELHFQSKSLQFFNKSYILPLLRLLGLGLAEVGLVLGLLLLLPGKETRLARRTLRRRERGRSDQRSVAPQVFLPQFFLQVYQFLSPLSDSI